MRILCVDFGEKRLGIAVSDPLGISAQGIEVLKKQADFSADLLQINQIISRYEDISEIVVGLPKTMKGEIGQQAQKTLTFVDYLKNNSTIPVITWDERLTTLSAQKSLREAGLDSRKQKKVIDKTAAAFILQSYMDFKKSREF